jgi:hypothetical protein
MTPEDAVNRINKIFEEAVLQHGGDMTEVINYVKARLGTVARQERDGVERVFERVVGFRPPDCRSRSLN